jgi:hypothetical protein
MATLHVRNFPDPLYESLRDCADANGRSIGAQTIQLLETALTAGPARAFWLGRRRRPPLGGSAFQRFTPRGRGAVAASQAEARALRHDHVGTEHLLLGLLQTDGVAQRALTTLGVALAAARKRVAAEHPPAAEPPPGQIPFSPEAKKALELALRESLALRHTSIGTEHVLLGIAAEGESLGARIVLEREPQLDRLRGLVVRETGVPVVAAPASEFFVCELEGGPEAWQDALNQAADAGYDLVEIVGTRAIFGLRRP